jgi:hypothetical protein
VAFGDRSATIRSARITVVPATAWSYAKENLGDSGALAAQWKDERNVSRYWLHFDISAIFPRGWPPVIGVTGRDLDDCLGIIAHRYGPNPPPLTRVVKDPDLTDFRPGMAPLGWSLGVPVWRGIWYPPENLGGPEPPERQLSEPRWWRESR